MQRAITVIVLAMWLVACAQNETTKSTPSTNDPTAEAGSVPGPKQKCTYKRSEEVGFRLQRVCRYVYPTETTDEDK